MDTFFPVARLSEIPDPGKQVVECDEQLVVLFHVDGKVYCLDDVLRTMGDPSEKALWMAVPLFVPATAHALIFAQENRSACQPRNPRGSMKYVLTVIRFW